MPSSITEDDSHFEAVQEQMEKAQSSGGSVRSLFTSGAMRKHMKAQTKMADEAEGKDLAGDFRVVGMGAALSALKEGIATKEAMMRESAEDEKDADKWLFAASQVEMFEKTLDDLMEAYLRWSLKPEDRGKGSDHADSNFN
eukprot:gene24509-12410_t